MKAGCLFVVVTAGLVAFGLGALLALSQLGSPSASRASGAPLPPAPAPSPTPLPDAYAGHVGSLNRFGRVEKADVYFMTYAFIDHLGISHEVTCGVRRKDYERETASYGYRPADIDARFVPQMQRWTDAALQSQGLASYVKIVVKGASAGYHWHWELPGMDAEEQERREREIESFIKWYAGAYKEKAAAVETTLYGERGFLLQRNVINIDYGSIVKRAETPLEDCSTALERAGRDYNRRQQLGLFVAFLQEIRYEVPPDIVNGRESLGLYVPTEVVVNDHGDCDSKSAVFAALWLRLGTPVILVSLPKHMLVGVEVKPGPREAYVRVGNRYFVLCEVAGPGKSHPGAHALSGSFEYVLLEPKA